MLLEPSLSMRSMTWARGNMSYLSMPLNVMIFCPSAEDDSLSVYVVMSSVEAMYFRLLGYFSASLIGRRTRLSMLLLGSNGVSMSRA